MAEIDNFEIWRRVRKAWTDNDRATLEQFIDPDMFITEPECLPYRGIFRGIDGYLELLKQISAVWEDDIKMEQGDIIGDPHGEKIAIEYFTTSRSRATGKTLVRARNLAMWRFKNGKVVEMRPYNFVTAEIVACITPD